MFGIRLRNEFNNDHKRCFEGVKVKIKIQYIIIILSALENNKRTVYNLRKCNLSKTWYKCLPYEQKTRMGRLEVVEVPLSKKAPAGKSNGKMPKAYSKSNVLER